jgi:hypothetical protein
MPLTSTLPKPTAAQANRARESGALQMITGHWVAQMTRYGQQRSLAAGLACGKGWGCSRKP